MCTCHDTQSATYVSKANDAGACHEAALPPELTAEIAALGQDSLRSRLRAQAVAGLAALPDARAVEAHEPEVRELLVRATKLVESALKAPEWTDHELASFRSELECASVGLSATATALARRRSGDNSDPCQRVCDAAKAFCFLYKLTGNIGLLFACVMSSLSCAACRSPSSGTTTA